MHTEMFPKVDIYLFNIDMNVDPIYQEDSVANVWYMIDNVK